MRDIIILGTGVHAIEIAEIIGRINKIQPVWNLLGYITHVHSNIGKIFNGFPILGTRDVLEKYTHACTIPDFEWPLKKEEDTGRMVSIIDPSSFISQTAAIEPGTVIYPHCFVGLNAKIGRCVFCLSGSIINHDCVLEDYVTLASGVSLAGSVYIEEGCYLGQSCTVKQHIRIGRNCLIGMGSVVIKNVEQNSVMAGNPAMRLRENK